MKRLLLILSLAGLFLLTGTSAAVVGLAEFAPFHPGQALFPIQSIAEHVLLGMNFDPVNLAVHGMDLLEKRMKNLEEAQGQSVEIESLREVQIEIDHVLNLFQAVPPEKEAALRERFIKILNTLQQSLPNYKYSAINFPEEFTAFRVKIAELKMAAQDINQPLANLIQKQSPASQNLLAPGNLPAGSLTATPAIINPRAIPFFPGSAGAVHAFFPLTGKHTSLACQSCHPQGIYAGTPNQCTDCHLSTRPANHFEGQCALCHTTNAWLPASFDHAALNATDCLNCHSKNRPANHFPSQCSACHSTSAWLPANFNHAAAGATDCVSCHNANRPTNHFAGQCSACHSTSAWRPASFNHAAVGATDCVTCHSANRPANHFSGQCSACHNTSGWRPATFNHAAVGATDCLSCHTGNRPANHFDGQCSSCHSTSGWLPANFNHSFPINHGGAGGVCSKCHPSGGSGWTCFTCHNENELSQKHNEEGIPDYVGRCMDCHANGEEGDDD